MKNKFLAFVMLTTMFLGCKPRTQELTPQKTAINPDLIEQAKFYFENEQSIALTKTVEVSLGARGNQINLFAFASFRTFNPVWNKTEQVNLLNGNKVLITPLRRNLKVDYNNLYYIRRLRIELNAQNQVVKANIVELVTLKHTVASQKYQIIANVFEEINTRTDAKIMIFDVGYTPQIESGSWKGEATNNNANAKGDNGTPPGCYQLIAVVSCSDVQFIQSPAPCDDPSVSFQGFGNPINNCPGGGGGSSQWTPPDPNNPPFSGQTGNSGNDVGQDQPLSANFTPAHIEDPEGIYKQYKTTILEYIPIISAFISNPPANAPAGMVDYMKLKLAALNKAKADMEAIEKSKHKYFFKSTPIVNNKADGETYYDVANSRVVVEFPENPPQGIALVLGVKAHEMHHAGQFERSEISFNKTTGKAGVLVDLKDEVASYEIQYLIHTNFFNYGKIDLNDKPSPNFVVNSTTVLALGIYNALPTTAINIHTDPQGTTLQNATNPTDIFVKP